jgi:hypothetical protein
MLMMMMIYSVGNSFLCPSYPAHRTITSGGGVGGCGVGGCGVGGCGSGGCGSGGGGEYRISFLLRMFYLSLGMSDFCLL